MTVSTFLSRLRVRPSPLPSEPDQAQIEESIRSDAYARIDLRDYRQDDPEPSFSPLVSQAVGAAQFDHPDYVHWAELLGLAEGGDSACHREHTPASYHRKFWEWAYVLQAAKEYDRLQPGMRAVGFGVGNEPIPAMLACYGLEIVATDQDAERESAATEQWAATGELLLGLSGLCRPPIIDDDQLAQHVTIRRVDMNKVAQDLGPSDLIWSSCALEHLGDPQRGLDFVLTSARLLAPGGVAVHTTEADLTHRETTADWGHLACYRPQDFLWLTDCLRAEGFETTLNLHIPMSRPQDRWVSVGAVCGPDLAVPELAHLKLILGESVCTSFGILIHRPD